MERDGRRRKETERDGRRWKEMEGEGRTRKEKEGERRKRKEKKGDGRRWKKKERVGRRRKEIIGVGRRRKDKEGILEYQLNYYPSRFINDIADTINSILLYCKLRKTKNSLSRYIFIPLNIYFLVCVRLLGINVKTTNRTDPTFVVTQMSTNPQERGVVGQIFKL